MILKNTLIAGVTAATLLGGSALVANAATTSSAASSTSAASSVPASAAASNAGGPMTGGGKGQGPTVDRSDMSAEQLAQVQKDEANGAPQQTGGPSQGTAPSN